MISRVLLLAIVGAGFLPAQLNLFLVQNGKDVASNDQVYGFGTKPVGGSVTLEFHLRNTAADTILTNIQLTNADFQFIPSPPSVPQAVPAGTALDFSVKFSPSQPGPAASRPDREWGSTGDVHGDRADIGGGFACRRHCAADAS